MPEIADIPRRKSVAVSDLRLDFDRIEALLRAGEEIQITKYGKLAATMIPMRAT